MFVSLFYVSMFEVVLMLFVGSCFFCLEMFVPSISNKDLCSWNELAGYFRFWSCCAICEAENCSLIFLLLTYF